MRIPYRAQGAVSEAIAGLGRTEDIRFSPSGGRLGVAEFANNRVSVFNIRYDSISHNRVDLSGVVQLSSPYLNKPHGLDFIDEETFIVANRFGHLAIFRLPIDSDRHELLGVLRRDESNFLRTPGSVTISRDRTNGLAEALVCNNYGHYVTRHLIDTHQASIQHSEILLQKWLRVPDGVCLSEDTRWIAVSNHDMHNVLIYENAAVLSQRSDPAAILRSICYPHGLRFTSDARFVLLADAGAPFIHIFEREGPSWKGVLNPSLSYRVMTNDVFLQGRYTPQEGGPKGLDLGSSRDILVTTCQHQPFAFFQLSSILQKATCEAVDSHEVDFAQELLHEAGDFHRASCVRHELEFQSRFCRTVARAEEAEKRRDKAEALCTALQGSTSWKLTAPVRALGLRIGKHRRLRGSKASLASFEMVDRDPD
jgi:hypothetical protein